jgi:signal transduction histidine kinase
VAGLAAGANDYVTKPFNTAELRARVAALVERRDLNDQARMDAALRERFIGILGHDLRQPLNTFIIGAGLLLLKDLPEKETKTIRRMAEAVERMKRMIGGGLLAERGAAPTAKRAEEKRLLHANRLYRMVCPRVEHPMNGHAHASRGLRNPSSG